LTSIKNLVVTEITASVIRFSSVGVTLVKTLRGTQWQIEDKSTLQTLITPMEYRAWCGNGTGLVHRGLLLFPEVSAEGSVIFVGERA